MKYKKGDILYVTFNYFSLDVFNSVLNIPFEDINNYMKSNYGIGWFRAMEGYFVILNANKLSNFLLDFSEHIIKIEKV